MRLTRLPPRALRSALLVFAVLPSGLAAQARPTTLYVSDFEGPEYLGRNVATIVNLQVWQTLRKEAPGSSATFGEGLVTWDNNAPITQSHESAERAAKDYAADLVLWGKVSRYGAGVVAQAFLTIAAGNERKVWEIQVDGRTLSLPLPRTRYEFRPIVLSNTIVSRYTSPDALQLYATPSSTTAIGTVGSEFKASRQEGDAALVTTNGKTGWIRLPELSRNRGEVANFTGGVIRILRSDWSGAADLFRKVIADTASPRLLKLDALLYSGVALERSRGNGAALIEQAYALNPYDRSVVSYLLMTQAAKLSRLASGDASRARVKDKGRSLITANRHLFPANDPWLKRCAEIFAP